jgi:hypothetical protein
MARIILGGKTVLNSGTDLDPMFVELYSGSYANLNFNAGSVGIGVVPTAYGGGTNSFAIGSTAQSLIDFFTGGVRQGLMSVNPTEMLLGTIVAKPLHLYTNGLTRLQVGTDGNISMGGVPGTYRLDVISTTGARILGGALRMVDSGSTTGASITPLTAGGGLQLATDGTPILIAPGFTTRMQFGTGGQVRPGADNAQAFGDGSLRWSTIYAATGAINTSDAREKTEVRPLDELELSASIRMAREIGSFQWLASIDEKGADSARKHIGLTVQRAIEILSEEGLDPLRYAFICYDKWDEEVTPARYEDREEENGLLDAEGKPIVRRWKELVAPESVRPGGDRYGFRYDQLAMFILRGQDERLRRLEAA